MDKCLVSVIVPVYYVDKQVFLACIRSITKQTERKIEILLVFDGTGADYEDILSDKVFQDDRLRIISKEHEGVSAARNRGLDQAEGQWVFFADADDCLAEDAIQRLLKGVRKETDLIIGDYYIKYPKETIVHSYKNEEFRIFHGNKVEFLEDILNPQTGMGFCWGKLYRRDCLNTWHIRFKESLEVAEDAEFVLQYVLRAREIRYLPCNIYFYQTNQDSAVRKFRTDYAGRYEKSMQCIFHTIRKAGYGIRLKEAYETCVLYHLLLITVNYSFHPMQKKSRKQKMKEYKELTEMPLYAEAIRKGDAGRFSLSRRITVWLIRLHLWRGVCVVSWIRHRQLKF